ncbi:uncharacterized protein [Argopecten irradians]|uniref:uncharacterized protein n=1 Tax=Argopecten irradians TaxID=31199 RepID=UPI003721F8F5
MAAGPVPLKRQSSAERINSGVSHSKIHRFSGEIPYFPDELIIKTATCVSDLTDVRRSAYCLTPLQVTSCNAAVPEDAFSFSNASCSVRPIEPMHVFGSIFGKGVHLLLNYLDERLLPENNKERHVLGKLLNYLVDTDSHAALEKVQNFSEAEQTICLVNHLFVKLAASPNFTVNKHSRRKQSTACPCGNGDCTLQGQYGDTSIGHEDVWHGSVAIIINTDVVLEPVEVSDYPESPDGEIPQESDLCGLESNPKIIAETIVFSFLKKQLHSESDHFLFPCVGAGGSELVFYFYDSENDVLLESSRVPLFIGRSNHQQTLNFSAVIACWLVVNYKYLCTGLTRGMLVPNKKAAFFSHAYLKLPIYTSKLKLGNVGSSKCSKKLCSSVDTSDEIILEAKQKIFKIQQKNIGRFAII